MDYRLRILAAGLIWFLALSVGADGQAAAQSFDPPTVGDCEEGEAQAFLDTGEVRAKILNTGGLFWNGGQPVYEVPKGEGAHSIFTTDFLIAGLVDGDLRMAGSTYGPFEFWPGPIPEDGTAPVACHRFDYIREVRRTGGEFPGPVHGLTGDIDNWPVDLGAPYVDRNGQPGYQPEEGDHPEIVGDQMLWWIMNDRGNLHRRTHVPPLGIEVRASAFAFDAVGAPGRATFYRYRIRNRHDRPIRAAYVGLMNDVDLGAFFDDYVGSDTTTGTAYFYNADNFDDIGEDRDGYGTAPPAIGFTVIKRPESTIDVGSGECSYEDGKSQGFTSHVHYIGGAGVQSDPDNAADFYNYFQGLWLDGLPVTFGGNGRESGEPTKFFFPGDPVASAFWSELNPDGSGRPTDPADRRSIAGLGPFCLGAGDETEVVFAIVWARGDSNLDSVTHMRIAAAGMQEGVDELLRPRTVVEPESEPSDFTALAASLYPNPAVSDVTLRLAVPQPMDARIEVFDALGREAAHIESGVLPEGNHTYELSVSD